MITRQNGFTLIEVLIAFSILTFASVLAVNVVTQSSMRTQHVSQHMGMLDVLESAIAELHVSLVNHQPEQEYQGSHINGYYWTAKVMGLENEPKKNEQPKLNLYRVKIAVSHESSRAQMDMLTLIPDR